MTNLHEIVIPQDLFAERMVHDLSLLKQSIQEKGVTEPLLVRIEGNSFVMLDGVKRWVCCYQLGMKTVPVVVTRMTYADSLEYRLLNSHKCCPIRPTDYRSALARLLKRQLERIKRLETYSHAPFDFTDLLRRIEKLEQGAPTL